MLNKYLLITLLSSGLCASDNGEPRTPADHCVSQFPNRDRGNQLRISIEHHSPIMSQEDLVRLVVSDTIDQFRPNRGGYFFRDENGAWSLTTSFALYLRYNGPVTPPHTPRQLPVEILFDNKDNQKELS